MQRAKAIIALRLPSGGTIRRALQVWVGRDTDDDVIEHCRTHWPDEQVIGVTYYPSYDGEHGEGLAPVPTTVADLARSIVNECGDPAELPDLHALKVAVLRAANERWPRSRARVSESTGVAVRTMSELIGSSRKAKRNHEIEETT